MEDVLKAVQDKLDAFKSSLPAYAKPEDVTKAMEGITAEVKGIADKNKEVQAKLDELKSAAEAQGLSLQKMIETAKNEKPVTLKDQLMPMAEKMQNIMKGSTERLTIKAAPNHLLANIASDNIGMAIPGVGQYQRRQPLLRSLLNNAPVSPNNHGQIFYTYQSAVASGAAGKAEGTAPNTTSLLSWTSAVKNLREVKDKVRITLKAMGDVDFMAEELNRFVNLNIAQAIEAQLYNGTDSTTSIDGILTLGTAYTAAGAGDNAKVATPNIMDLILVMKKAAMKDTMFNPTFALLSHEDYASLRYQKDDLGQYFISPFVQGPINIHGVLCLPSSLVTSDTMVIGDGMFSTVYSKGLNLQLGLDGNDFSEGYVTLLGVEELANIIKPSDAKAFQYVASIQAELNSMTKGA